MFRVGKRGEQECALSMCGVVYFLGFVFILCVQPLPVSILMLNVSSPSWRKCKNWEG